MVYSQTGLQKSFLELAQALNFNATHHLRLISKVQKSCQKGDKIVVLRKKAIQLLVSWLSSFTENMNLRLQYLTTGNSDLIHNTIVLLVMKDFSNIPTNNDVKRHRVSHLAFNQLNLNLSKKTRNLSMFENSKDQRENIKLLEVKKSVTRNINMKTSSPIRAHNVNRVLGKREKFDHWLIMYIVDHAEIP
ncbi:CLUMA_CG014707, isoform A [Clunio marinus]|uniref:CLUMA_CG014707, isoform A n=1 Tax=Clunio marinus TaxID=568069 RepID=A0A1J1IRR4_9DIPT|nr:CLUMA_CG014707, isoform A [Clunio marinus]